MTKLNVASSARWLVLGSLLSCFGCQPSPASSTTSREPTTKAESPTADASNHGAPAPATVTLLNVSYDPTRELFQAVNAAFAEEWHKKTGQTVRFEQSHGGSGKQARAVIDGLEADLVTLAVAQDIDAIAEKSKLIEPYWQSRFPHNSAPYTSTIVFLVRPGNPRNIRDWNDLIQDNIALVAANPKTGGGARWNYLAAWGYALKRSLGNLDRLQDPNAAEDVKKAQNEAQRFVAEIYRRMAVLDSGARTATTSFLQREIGDALICWENEAHLAVHELGTGKAEIVIPSISILAEPAVALVDKNVDKHGTREVATEFLNFLYSPIAQPIVARYYYRPAKPELVPADQLKNYPQLELFTINQVFGGWTDAQRIHFADGGVFDQIYQPGNAKKKAEK